MADSDVLAQLLEASWRGIPVPTILVSTKAGHGIAVHKRMDRDGWLIENTGRNSTTVTVRIPFVNTIAKGRNETWKDLYPGTYRKFLAALEDRSPGTFVHPDYGEILAQVTEWSVVLDPHFRGGVVLEVTFLETVPDGEALPSLASDFAVAKSAAISLDGTVTLFFPEDPTDGLGSFEEFVNDLQAIGDQIDLARQQVIAKIDRVVAKVEALKETVGNTVSGFVDTANRFVSAMYDIQKTIATIAKPTDLYRVPKTTTTAVIANRLRNSASEILSLNSFLAGSATVPINTVVKYYTQNAAPAVLKQDPALGAIIG